jgi:hypothetical protein
MRSTQADALALISSERPSVATSAQMFPLPKGVTFVLEVITKAWEFINAQKREKGGNRGQLEMLLLEGWRAHLQSRKVPARLPYIARSSLRSYIYSLLTFSVGCF